MKTSAGIWIDHRKAFIVTITGAEQATQELRSGVESQPGREDGIPMDVHHEALLVKADDSHQREYTGHMNGFYAKVIAATGPVGTLWIFGPGEAKGQLKERFEQARFAGHVLDLETVDKLTDRQIAAKVRERFLHRNPITSPK